MADRAEIGKRYDNLLQLGYFTDGKEGKGGNESYIGDLVLKAIPATAHSILEIGPATGLLLEKLLRANETLTDVCAVEISPAMAQQLKARLMPLIEERKGQLQVIEDDFQKMTDVPSKDVVIASYVAEYTTSNGTNGHGGASVEAFVNRLYSLVKPGGVLIWVDIIQPAKVDLIGTFAMITRIYLQHGLVPPLWKMIKNRKFMDLFQEPEFNALSEFHEGYCFSVEQWQRLADQLGGKFTQLTSLTGMLVASKK